MKIKIKKHTIEEFKGTWPCNNFPKNLDSIVAEFDKNKDLTSYELLSIDNNVIDNCQNKLDIDEYALSALLELFFNIPIDIQIRRKKL